MAHSYIFDRDRIQSNTQLLAFLQKNFSLLKESKTHGLCYYFDTFDWRLYRQGYYLHHYNNTFVLSRLYDKKIEVKQENVLKSPDYLSLPDGPLQQKIAPIIGIRALMCKAIFRLTEQTVRILNKDLKTIARIKFEQSKIKDKSKYIVLPPFFKILPLRGYANQIPGILKKLSSLNLSQSKGDRLQRGLSAIGKTPADYTSKLDIKLNNRMTAETAAKQIYLYLLNIIRKNEFGIIEDIDIEFLHDFRVSIRRTRSALGQLKGILDEKAVLKAKENFLFLGRSTNNLRDIDVYLLKEKQYKAMLPVELREYLNAFFENLHSQRKTELRSLIAILKSAKYKRIISSWNGYLDSVTQSNRSSALSAKLLAQTVIMKRNKKVIKFGKRILLTGSDELLHQLRIEGKKLRYLLEFFSSLFAQEKIQYLIGKLKILQDNLGEFNDLIIQQEHLFESVRNIAPRNKTTKNTLLAMGVLIGKLNERQQAVKNEFAMLFSNYADKKVQKIFNELFYVHERPAK